MRLASMTGFGLNQRTYTIRLFDAYGRLLTARQQRLMRLYYLDDLSLGEIAERLRITRQAVHDSLQRSVEEMSRIETHLGLVVRPRRGGAGASVPGQRARVRTLARRLRRLADEMGHETLREIASRLEAIEADL